MKLTKTNAKQLQNFMAIMDENGCVPLDKWTTGSGKYTSMLTLPPFAAIHEAKQYDLCNKPQHGTTERTAYNFFAANARRRKVIVLDVKAVNELMFASIVGREI